MAITRACGKRSVGVGFELDALLEVDEVELDLVGRVVERDVGDQRVQQRRLAGAGLAGDEHVLRRADAEAERLEFLGPCAADGDDQLPAAVAGPEFVGGGGDHREGDFDAPRLLAAVPAVRRRPLSVSADGGRSSSSGSFSKSGYFQTRRLSAPLEVHGVRGEIVIRKLVRQLLVGIDAQQREDAAAGAALAMLK